MLVLHTVYPHIHPVVCRSLPPLLNGSISYSDPPQDLGSVASHTCDIGSTLNGSRNRTCNLYGTWNGSAPSCTMTKGGCWSCLIALRASKLVPIHKVLSSQSLLCCFVGLSVCLSVIGVADFHHFRNNFYIRDKRYTSHIMLTLLHWSS